MQLSSKIWRKFSSFSSFKIDQTFQLITVHVLCDFSTSRFLNSMGCFSLISSEAQGRWDTFASDWSDLNVLFPLLYNLYTCILTGLSTHTQGNLLIHGLKSSNNHSYDLTCIRHGNDQICGSDSMTSHRTDPPHDVI